MSYHRIFATLLTAGVCALMAAGCAMEAGSDSNSESVGEAEQAVLLRVSTTYYSDPWLTQRVGNKTTSCNGGFTTWGQTNTPYVFMITYNCHLNQLIATDACYLPDGSCLADSCFPCDEP